MKEVLTDANFPRDAEGHTYHVNTKPGEVANRIVVVGDYVRARRIAAHFDGGKGLFEHTSQRNFLTITGLYQGTPVSVVAIGMGFAVVDFFVRECRAVVGGDMVIVRVGSCGSVNQEVTIGTVAVPPASVGISRNYDHFHPSTFTGETDSPLTAFQVTKPLPADEDVHAALVQALESTRPSASEDRFAGQEIKIYDAGLNGSADAFYGSQGRIDSQFVDDNKGLIQAIQEEHPTLSTLEMETYVLHHLALCANYAAANKERADALAEGSLPRIKTAAMQMIFANRNNAGFITPDEVQLMEEWCGKAVLEALIAVPIADDRIQPTEGSVWAVQPEV